MANHNRMFRSILVTILLAFGLSTAQAAGMPAPGTLMDKACIRTCAQDYNSCLEEAARRFKECVDDFANDENPCPQCIALCHAWFADDLEACKTVAGECRLRCYY